MRVATNLDLDYLLTIYFAYEVWSHSNNLVWEERLGLAEILEILVHVT